MLKDSLKILAETPPPVRAPWRFKTARSATAEINRLENLLGMPPSGLAFNMAFANRRISELESMLAAKTAALPSEAAIIPTISAPPVVLPAQQKHKANLSADAQIAQLKQAGIVTTPAGARLRAQKTTISADLSKLTGVSRECANQILKKS